METIFNLTHTVQFLEQNMQSLFYAIFRSFCATFHVELPPQTHCVSFAVASSSRLPGCFLFLGKQLKLIV